MHKPIKEWFKDEWGNDYEVLDCALVHRSTLYGAIKKKSTGNVFATIFLIRWSRNEYNFAYKDMTEFSGPNECECPERILKLLSPLDDTTDPNGWGRKWRDKVIKHWDTQRKLNSGKFLIKTDEPVKFTNGLSFSYFKKSEKRFYAGALQVNGIFASFCMVRFNPKYYNYELVEYNPICISVFSV
jgi:hypothetical protein